MPAAPVCGLRSVMPRISLAARLASAGDFASLMPPALPRPPACTWALTATFPPPNARAASSASAGVQARRPSGTATPNSRNSAFA